MYGNYTLRTLPYRELCSFRLEGISRVNRSETGYGRLVNRHKLMIFHGINAFVGFPASASLEFELDGHSRQNAFMIRGWFLCIIHD
jgi:hypothetical protein